MPTLTLGDFETFFAEVHDGERPYPWQSSLVREIAAGHWPDQLVAPTGSGKSVLVEALVFLRALSLAEGKTFPRRFVMAVPRRALVDSQALQAQRLAAIIAGATEGVLKTVRSLLSVDGAEPLQVSILRGGIALDSGWLDDPVGCQILAVTPDMLGSRLLFRGYLASPPARPRHAGLLAYDTVAIVDESHLNTQLVMTLRRVGELAARSPLAEFVPALRVVETTATPGETDGLRVVVDAADGDSRLEARLRAVKQLELERLETWPIPHRSGKARTAPIDRIAAIALELHGEAAGTVGVIMNRVQDALAVAEALDKSGSTRVAVLVGPMRPVDRVRLERDHPGLLAPEGDPELDVLVATQTVEVGVDLDLHGLVTEIASATSIVQRVGRVNRRGLIGSTRVVVVGPEDATEVDIPLPYQKEDIQTAMEWLDSIGDGGDLSPAALAGSEVPHVARRRMLLSRLEPAEAALLSRTSEQLFAEPELDLWLRDDLDPERPEVSVVGRALPVDIAAARELLEVAPPQPHEMYPTPIGNARALARRADGQAHLWRGGAVQESDRASEIAALLRPGDVLVLESTVAGARRGVVAAPGVDGNLEPLGDVLEDAMPGIGPGAGRSTGAPVLRVLIRDELILQAGGGRADRDLPREVLLLDRLPAAVEAATTEKRDEGSGAEGRAGLRTSDPGLLTAADIEAQLPTAEAAVWNDLFREGEAREFILPAAPDSEDRYPWLVIADHTAQDLDADQIQERSLGGRVRLSDHQRDVAERAERLARRLDFPDVLVDVFREAGVHHDDGKIASPWQSARLGNPPSATPLAKAPVANGQSRRRLSGASLPSGWRHEQLSVALAWPGVVSEHRELVARLIGTSHGHGRMAFPHGSAELITTDQAASREAARVLFDEGVWDELVDQTDRHWGVWGAAYLEAVLRAADVQVSKEGH